MGRDWILLLEVLGCDSEVGVFSWSEVCYKDNMPV
jgi:hypothetical protein